MQRDCSSAVDPFCVIIPLFTIGKLVNPSRHRNWLSKRYVEISIGFGLWQWKGYAEDIHPIVKIRKETT